MWIYLCRKMPEEGEKDISSIVGEKVSSLSALQTAAMPTKLEGMEIAVDVVGEQKIMEAEKELLITVKNAEGARTGEEAEIEGQLQGCKDSKVSKESEGGLRTTLPGAKQETEEGGKGGIEKEKEEIKEKVEFTIPTKHPVAIRPGTIFWTKEEDSRLIKLVMQHGNPGLSSSFFLAPALLVAC